jgi:mycothione reductase
VAHYDLAIIGTGSGNTLVGPEFAHWQIAIIEESTFGGTCINVGCIPTKMYVYPADLARHARESSRLGVDMTLDQVHWAQIRDRIFGRIDAISVNGREWRRSGRPNISLHEGHAEFSGPNELTLSTGEVITAEQIVLATGARAEVPDVIRDSGVTFHTSDTVMRIDAVPPRVAVYGGGYIAAEFAGIFSAFGAETTMICRSQQLLRHLDQELAAAFTERAKENWNVLAGTTIVAATEATDGEISLELSDGSRLAVDLLLVATGRVPNGDRLGLEVAGVQQHPNGRIVVDEFQRTTAPNIWALGDASTEHQLKHVANHEARIVAHNVAHPDDLIAADHRFVPSAVFTHPQLASVGLTEQEAAATGRRYVTSRQDYAGTAYGWAMEDTTSFCKLIADPATGKLLGAHLMGEQASTLIQPLIQAMSFGLGVHDMARGQYWIHPALTEVVENALLHLELD